MKSWRKGNHEIENVGARRIFQDLVRLRKIILKRETTVRNE